MRKNADALERPRRDVLIEQVSAAHDRYKSADQPCEVWPEGRVLPWSFLAAQLIAFLSGWFDEVRIAPLHELVAYRNILQPGFGQVEHAEEREACIESPVVFGIEL